MVTRTSLFRDKIGVVFTPESLARRIAQDSGCLAVWLSGGTICEPSCGRGAFVFALCDLAIEKGRKITAELLARFILIEKEEEFISEFRSDFFLRYGLVYPSSSIYCADLILDNLDIQADFVIGNPPWVSFSDLPQDYKSEVKPKYIEEGIVDSRSITLGGSRVDIAALFVSVVLRKILKRPGSGALILPLSLFFSDGAHSMFRKKLSESGFGIRKIVDLTDSGLFEGVATKHGVVYFGPSLPAFSSEYFSSIEAGAGSELRQDSPLASFRVGSSAKNKNVPRVTVQKIQTPRQGINTCGANDLFFFETKPDFIESDLIYPLAQKEQFRNPEEAPKKFIFLPYDKASGRPLGEIELSSQFPKAYNYLLKHHTRLSQRKGVMILSFVKRGYWWALLGVGPYCFSPYKVIWEAYGKHTFSPVILGSFETQIWQANQALQAYIPCDDLKDAERIRMELELLPIEADLKEKLAGGTCNWAQPGRIKEYLSLL